jgi:hypothetical protein
VAKKLKAKWDRELDLYYIASRRWYSEDGKRWEDFDGRPIPDAQLKRVEIVLIGGLEDEGEE